MRFSGDSPAAGESPQRRQSRSNSNFIDTEFPIYLGLGRLGLGEKRVDIDK